MVLGPAPKPSIEKAPNLELKTLSSHLTYAFLGENSTLHVILFESLTDEHVERELDIPKKRKAALGCQMFVIH